MDSKETASRVNICDDNNTIRTEYKNPHFITSNESLNIFLGI